jgi:hypothetical protein
MQSRRIKPGVPVVLSGPSGDVTVIEYLDLASKRTAFPHEQTVCGRLAPAAEFGRVVRDRRPEVGTPSALGVVSESAWVGQDFDARVAHFDGQGMRVGGDAEIPVWAAVASAQDLILSARAQERNSRASHA